MRMVNGAGEIVYYNVVDKHGGVRYVVLAASGQVLPGRDRQKRKSRTFTKEFQAAAYLKRLGYKVANERSIKA